MSSKTPTTATLTSADGTIIGYRQMGAGPGVILVHGGLQASQNFTKLGAELAEMFTVYIPDRRGRGMSGPHGNYSLQAECEDIQAIITKTGAEYVFGLSSGAIVSLYTAIHTPAIKKLAIYEPPLPVHTNLNAKWYRRYQKQLHKGNLGAAFVHILKGVNDFSLFTVLPASITGRLINKSLKSREKDVVENEVPLAALIPTFEYDHIAVAQSAGIVKESKSLKAQLLLMGGTKSKKFLKNGIKELRHALPHAKYVEFKGFGHIAADNSERPDLVAAELKKFFGD